ncbi:addiction module protein [Litoribacter alkaliphilus]|uniref:Addiction module protein n=1 Tax=Litoribacter ruber TaxID=702568 RepID=A0AAP2G0G2_9BACT|nr:addiction module protein [Litoribacter alkaliphilus]MBS9522754.1 addiction module protein [Litoribacter alkaliphilus]
MDLKTVKTDLIHWVKDLKDKSVLQQLQELKKQHEDSLELSESQRKELDLRLKKYEEGQMHFSSWDEVKDRVRKRHEDDL